MSNLSRRQASMFPFGSMWPELFREPLVDLAGLATPDSMIPASLQMDVEETDEGYGVSVMVPGVTREQIDVEINQNRLNVTVDKKDSEEVQKKNYLRRETSEYHATRSVYLKDAAKEGLSATLKDGVLAISVPKQKHDENIRKIEIG